MYLPSNYSLHLIIFIQLHFCFGSAKPLLEFNIIMWVCWSCYVCWSGYGQWNVVFCIL